MTQSQLILVTNKEKIKLLYEESALTFELINGIIDNNIRREAEKVPINHFLS